jgi:hypothetical protein
MFDVRRVKKTPLYADSLINNKNQVVTSSKGTSRHSVTILNRYEWSPTQRAGASSLLGESEESTSTTTTTTRGMLDIQGEAATNSHHSLTSINPPPRP